MYSQTIILFVNRELQESLAKQIHKCRKSDIYSNFQLLFASYSFNYMYIN